MTDIILAILIFVLWSLLCALLGAQAAFRFGRPLRRFGAYVAEKPRLAKASRSGRRHEWSGTASRSETAADRKPTEAA